MLKILRMRRDMRTEFYKKYKSESQNYSPKKVKLPPHTTMFNQANVLLAIREAAKRRVQIRFLYRRVSYPIGSIEYYQVSPMSYRYRKLKVGVRKVLYAWDEEKLKYQMLRKTRFPKLYKGNRRLHGTTKSFVLRNILNCCITEEPYSKWCKRYRVEIL